MTGGPNEVWSYGEQAYGIVRDHVMLRSEPPREGVEGSGEVAGPQCGAVPLAALPYGADQGQRPLLAGRADGVDGTVGDTTVA